MTAQDPDGDDVALSWWCYAEAGTCPEAAEVSDDGDGNARVWVPQAAEPGQTIHLIAEGTDCASRPFTRYQRVVLTVR